MDIELQEISEWKSIRKKVKNNFEYNSDWEKAINVFKTRLNRKFFNPLGELIKQNKQKGEGFTIVTTQCALIESLASFRTGQVFNHKRNKKSPIFEYSHSKDMFVKFLQTDGIFENNFWTIENGKKKKNFPFDANKFYSDVRCGLMHEARTKNEWFINTTKKSIKTEKIFIEKEGNKVKILRSILHHRLKNCVEKYCADLKATDKNGEKLRKLFGRKLDHLFDIKRNSSYDWWK